MSSKTTTKKAAPLKIALLGSGKSTRVFHGPYILRLPDLWTLHAVYERGATPDKSRARDHFGDEVKVYTTLEETLADPEVDVTCVVVPQAAHYELAKRSILAGKHVIVEKPFTTTLAQAEELLKLSREKEVYLIPFQNRRYDNDFLTVRKLIENKILTDIIDFESRYDCNVDWNLPSSGTGILSGLGSHLIDQVVSLFGKPSTVFADCWNGRGVGHPDTIDSVNILLRYADSPRRVTLRISAFSAREKQERYLVRGKNVSFSKDGMDPQEEQTLAGMSVSDPRFGVEDEIWSGTLCKLAPSDPARPSPYLRASSERIKSEKGDYTFYYQDAAKAILGLKEQYVKAEHAVINMAIIEAAKKSSDEGMIVRLD
ncbi:NAD binding Rossmann fold oxidoreductase [Meredithblackwellia eburnea MCA 4105]